MTSHQDMMPTDYAWSSWADITNEPLDQSRSIPEDAIQILEQLFNARRSIHRSSPGGPPGTLGILVRQTTVVVKLSPLTLNLAKSIIGAMAALFSRDPMARAGGMIAVADALPKLKTCVVNLNPSVGQMCTYASVLRAGSDVQRDIGMRPTVLQVVQAHIDFRPHCTQTSCQYFRNGTCGIGEADLDGVIDGLKQAGILTQPSQNQLWVAL